MLASEKLNPFGRILPQILTLTALLRGSIWDDLKTERLLITSKKEPAEAG
jgi:hypothetical protein